MQIFVKTLEGSSRTVSVEPWATVRDLKASIEDFSGIPSLDQRLLFGTKQLTDESSMEDCGVERGSTVNLALRLRGGKPVKVLMMTDHLPCGGEVTIDVDDDTPKHEIMEKLFKATGVPVEHQVVRLGGLNQLMMGDKRTNVRFNVSCGTSSNIHFAVEKAGK